LRDGVRKRRGVKGFAIGGSSGRLETGDVICSGASSVDSGRSHVHQNNHVVSAHFEQQLTFRKVGTFASMFRSHEEKRAFVDVDVAARPATTNQPAVAPKTRRRLQTSSSSKAAIITSPAVSILSSASSERSLRVGSLLTTSLEIITNEPCSSCCDHHETTAASVPSRTAHLVLGIPAGAAAGNGSAKGARVHAGSTIKAGSRAGTK
jgi:hypothetical protein